MPDDFDKFSEIDPARALRQINARLDALEDGGGNIASDNIVNTSSVDQVDFDPSYRRTLIHGEQIIGGAQYITPPDGLHADWYGIEHMLVVPVSPGDFSSIIFSGSGRYQLRLLDGTLVDDVRMGEDTWVKIVFGEGIITILGFGPLYGPSAALKTVAFTLHDGGSVAPWMVAP